MLALGPRRDVPAVPLCLRGTGAGKVSGFTGRYRWTDVRPPASRLSVPRARPAFELAAHRSAGRSRSSSSASRTRPASSALESFGPARRPRVGATPSACSHRSPSRSSRPRCCGEVEAGRIGFDEPLDGVAPGARPPGPAPVHRVARPDTHERLRRPRPRGAHPCAAASRAELLRRTLALRPGDGRRGSASAMRRPRSTSSPRPSAGGSGRPFESSSGTSVLDPLGMADTTFDPRPGGRRGWRRSPSAWPSLAGVEDRAALARVHRAASRRRRAVEHGIRPPPVRAGDAPRRRARRRARPLAGVRRRS